METLSYCRLMERMLAAEARVVELAMENVGLKSFGDKLNDIHNALNGEGTGIQGRAEVACQQVALEAAIEEFDAIETPATDRIVAEAEARGVVKFAKYIALYNSDAEWHAVNFVQQLRESAK